MAAIVIPRITQFRQQSGVPRLESCEILSEYSCPFDPTLSHVVWLLKESLRQLDELGLAIPASHVDHALALLQPAPVVDLMELLEAAEDLIDVARHSRHVH